MPHLTVASRPSGDTVPGPVLPDRQLKYSGQLNPSADELLPP